MFILVQCWERGRNWCHFIFTKRVWSNCSLCAPFFACSYDKKRVVIRAGTKGNFCYLIFAGSVFVNIKEHNKQTGGYYYHTVSVLHKGCFFGVCCFTLCVCLCVCIALLVGSALNRFMVSMQTKLGLTICRLEKSWMQTHSINGQHSHVEWTHSLAAWH